MSLPLSYQDRLAEAAHRGEIVTAPKVKIVACKSADAQDGKKPKNQD